MNAKYIIFKFTDSEILISYVCKGKEISKSEIEDALSSYLDSDAYDEDTDYETIIDDVMVSFENDDIEYHIENFSTIVID